MVLNLSSALKSRFIRFFEELADQELEEFLAWCSASFEEMALPQIAELAKQERNEREHERSNT